MNKDVSFLLPSNRNFYQYAKKVIDNINSLEFNGLTHEIIFISPENISEENVTCVFDDCTSGGCVWGYNEGYKKSTGKYIFLCSDDHYFDKNCISSLKFFNSNHFKNKKIKIFCLPTNNHGPCDLPEYCDIKTIIARYPVFERQTVEEYLNGYIYNPIFKHHYPDNWLGYWMAKQSEPIIEISKYDMITFNNSCIKTNDSYDEEAFKKLIKNYNEGYTKYV